MVMGPIISWGLYNFMGGGAIMDRPKEASVSGGGGGQKKFKGYQLMFNSREAIRLLLGTSTFYTIQRI